MWYILSKFENFLKGGKLLLYVVSPSISRTFKRNEQLWRLMDGSMIEGRPLTVSEEELQNILSKNSLDILDSIIQRLDFGNIAVEKEVLFGDPYIKILKTAEKERSRSLSLNVLRKLT